MSPIRRSFGSKDELALALAEAVSENLRLAIADRGVASLAVSGGSTPGRFFMALGKKRVYVLNEIASSVSVFENGKLLETVNALPDGFTGASSAAEVVIDKAEKFLYSSNRGADTIAVFRIGAGLKKVGDVKVGPVPRGFVLSPDGKFFAYVSDDGGPDDVYLKRFPAVSRVHFLEFRVFVRRLERAGRKSLCFGEFGGFRGGVPQ